MGLGGVGAGECVICLNPLCEDLDTQLSPARRSKKGYQSVVAESGEGLELGAVATSPPAEESAVGAASAQNKVVKVECDHLFHETCIQDWLKVKDTCPVCRHPLVVRDVVPPAQSPATNANPPDASDAAATDGER